MANEKEQKSSARRIISGFSMDEKELNSKINDYKQMTADGTIELPSWSDFCSRAGITEAIAAEVMERAEDGPTSAYYERGRALSLLWQWCRAQYMSAPGWSATAARCTKALALYRMLPCGDERARPSAVQGKAGVKELVISFGANDKRAKEAGK